MIISEKALETRGVFRNEIIDYFISIGGEEVEDERVVGDDWEVEVGEEKFVALGSIKITSTMVTFKCQSEILDKMVSAFRLRFLKAGG